ILTVLSRLSRVNMTSSSREPIVKRPPSINTRSGPAGSALNFLTLKPSSVLYASPVFELVLPGFILVGVFFLQEETATASESANANCNNPNLGMQIIVILSNEQ